MSAARPIVLAILASLTTGVGAAGAAPTPGQVSASISACHQAADPAERYATFDARMNALPGSETLSIRFELDERASGKPRFHAIRGVPGFGMWTQSAPGVDIFGYSHEVSGLSAPAAFRVTVSFRWLGSGHRVIRLARRVTPACSVSAASPLASFGSLVPRAATARLRPAA